MLGVVVRNDVAQSQFSSGHVNWSAKRTEQSLGAKLVQVLLRSGKAGNYASWAILLEEAANRIFSAALRAASIGIVPRSRSVTGSRAACRSPGPPATPGSDALPLYRDIPARDHA
jgi:hypothetical protein